VEYLNKHGILNSKQFGFQKGKSTSTLLLEFSNFVNSKLNDNLHILALFVDFSKAFDTINHQKLLQALESIGIRGIALDWFRNYLTDRFMEVHVNGHVSEERHCDSGVPQGSILGPTLFLIYVNFMSKCHIYCFIFSYADDTVLLAVHFNIRVAHAMLQSDFNSLLRWNHDKELVINSSKTKIVHICTPHNHEKDFPINIIYHDFNCIHTMAELTDCECSGKIECVNTYEYLGLTVDRHFSWKYHIDKLCNRLRSCSSRLYILKHVLPFSLFRTVYQSIAESLILYGILAWGNASRCHIQRVEDLQIKMLKIVMCDFKTDSELSRKQIFSFCNVLPISSLFIYRFILHFYFKPDFKIPLDSCKDTRLKVAGAFKIPNFNNKYGQRSLSYSVPSTFNLMPSSLKTLSNISKIKTKLKSYLLSDTF
jgi:hypothetical protein